MNEGVIVAADTFGKGVIRFAFIRSLENAAKGNWNGLHNCVRYAGQDLQIEK